MIFGITGIFCASMKSASKFWRFGVYNSAAKKISRTTAATGYSSGYQTDQKLSDSVSFETGPDFDAVKSRCMISTVLSKGPCKVTTFNSCAKMAE